MTRANGIGNAYGHESSFFTIGNTYKGVTVTAGMAIKKAIMHGIVRGMVHAGQGGRFESGFASGFVSSSFSIGNKDYGGISARTAIMAVVGGTSQITGGKFSNGAMSGAFVHLFNAEQKGFVGGMKEFGKMFGTALEFITFRGEAMDSVPYEQVGQDAISAVQNAHPAAQAVLVVAGAQVMLGGVVAGEATVYTVVANPVLGYEAIAFGESIAYDSPSSTLGGFYGDVTDAILSFFGAE